MCLRYDWRCHRFSRFPDPNGNSHIDGSCHGNRHSNCYRNATWHTNGYSYCHRRCVADPYTKGNSTYANTPASPDTGASPVGSCISSDR